MSFSEWTKAQKKKEQEGTASLPGKSSTTSDNPSSSGKKKTFTEWTNEQKSKNATVSLSGWAESSKNLLDDVQKHYSSWRGKDDERYSELQDRASTLLAQADSWRKQYADNSEAISHINSVVEALSKAKSYALRNSQHYSQWETEDDYNRAVEQWQEYQEKWGHYADAADFDEYAKKGAAIKNPTMKEAESDGRFLWWTWGGEDVGNIVTYSRENADMLAMANANNQNTQGNYVYRNMSDDEVRMYNYLLAKEGKETADSYLSYLEPYLKNTEGKNMSKRISSIDIPVVEDLAVLGLGFGAGLDQWASGTRQFFTEEEITPSVTQYANAYMSESLDGVGHYAHQAATTIGNMAPSILVSYVLGSFGAPPQLAQAAGATTMGISAAGNAYSDALSKGYDKGQARAYGILVGASEGGLQYLMGGIGKLGGVSTQKIMSKVAMIDNSLLRVAAKLGVDLISEIGEEELQNFLEPAFRMIILGEDYDAPTIDELIETAIVTAITTPILGAKDTIMEDVSESKYYSDLYGANAQELVQEGLESPEGSLSRKLAEKYQARLDAGNDLNGNMLGRMVEANEQQFRSDDLANIQSAAESRLTELGETGDVGAIAAALTK